MPEGRHQKRNSLVVWLVVILLFVSFIYVALSGPAVWLFQHGYFRKSLPIVYRPLIALEVSDTPYGRPIRWYWSLWDAKSEARQATP